MSECKHGRLARSCPECDLMADLVDACHGWALAEEREAHMKIHLGMKTALAKAILKRLRKWQSAGNLWRLRAHHWKGEAIRARQGRPEKIHGRMDFRMQDPLPLKHSQRKKGARAYLAGRGER